MIATGTHDPYLVALSILVASFASYTALDLGGRVGTARGLARRVWLVAAAITMGGGIWSMHFVAMLAFKMPIPMSYDIGLTILSLVVAIFVTSGGLPTLSSARAGLREEPSLHGVHADMVKGMLLKTPTWTVYRGEDGRLVMFDDYTRYVVAEEIGLEWGNVEILGEGAPPPAAL